MTTPISSSVPPEPVASAAGARPLAMGRAVASGSFWMILNAVVQRGASFAAQIALGWLLSDRDFGLYALAISISAIAAGLRDGGVRQLLIQRHHDYGTLIGPVFWMAIAINMAIGASLAGAAPVLAGVFGEPSLTGLLLVIAAAQPLGTPGSILTARLAIDLRFRQAARIQTVSSLIRYCGAVVLAALGFGPMSFVLPLPVLAVVEWAMAYAYTRERPWRLAPVASRWWGLLVEVRWILVGTVAVVVINLGAGVAVKPFVATEVVGMYFFAYQIVVQIGMLINANVVQVFFPAFAKIASDQERLRQAAGRSLRQLMLIGAPMCIGLAATFAPLELLVWRGKWSGTVDAVMVSGMLYPAVVATAVPLALLQALGRFRAWGLALAAMGALTLTGSAIGAAVWGSAAAIAGATSVGAATAGLVLTMTALAGVGVGLPEVARALAPAWMISLCAGAVAVWLDRAIAPGVPAAGRALICAPVFAGVFGLLARVALARDLREALAMLPVRIAAPAGRLLMLKAREG